MIMWRQKIPSKPGDIINTNSAYPAEIGHIIQTRYNIQSSLLKEF